MQECPIKLKQTMAATKSLCEFYGGQFFRKMIATSRSGKETLFCTTSLYGENRDIDQRLQ